MGDSGAWSPVYIAGTDPAGRPGSVSSLEDKIIGLYSLGTSFRDISAHIKETYDTDISATTLSSITDKVIPLVKEWQQRPLEELYCIVWLDMPCFTR